MRIVVKKYGVHKKVVSGINVKLIIILVFVVTVLEYIYDEICNCALFRVLYV
jgi:hypothetical protein